MARYGRIPGIDVFVGFDESVRPLLLQQPLTLFGNTATFIAVFGASGGVGLPLTRVMAKGTDQFIDPGMNGACMRSDCIFSDVDLFARHGGCSPADERNGISSR